MGETRSARAACRPALDEAGTRVEVIWPKIANSDHSWDHHVTD
jgi:hypothetical protein